MRYWTSIFLLFIFSNQPLLSQPPLRNGKDYAVFFYVTTFQHGWEQLPDTRPEVEAIAAELERHFGFQVEIVPNPSRQQMLDKIAEVNRRTQKDDQILFFFSMHGHYDPVQDEGFLIPADGLRQDPYGDSWISYANLGRRITSSPSRHVLLALDACYSGAFGIRNAKKGGDIALPWEKDVSDCELQVKRALRHQSRLYCSSGSLEERTPARSLFAMRWLEVLRKGEELGVIRMEDLTYFLGKVESPRPEDGSFTNHEPNGDFVFVHRTACSTASAGSTVAADRDGDGFSDAHDECPDDYGTARGCLDTDNDGIPNKNDQCPYEAGTADQNGCPAPADRDGDGIPDLSDQCKDKKGPAHYQGCPDSDQDKVPDHLDHCPQEKGSPANDGCPEKNTDLPGFVFVQGGTFQMGSNEGESDEKPVHRVTLDDFYLHKTEVTFDEYLDFCEDAKREVPPDEGWGHGQRPVINVTWYDAVAYCNWRSEREDLQKVYTINGSKVSADWAANGYRLPTEAEWEYAARSRGKNEKWAGTSAQGSLSSFANSFDKGDGYDHTAPVGSFRPNALGLYDMSGNVWEWCWDLQASYPSSAQTNPRGPDSGRFRTLRGGGWRQEAAYLQCTLRRFNSPRNKFTWTGFRLAKASP